MRILLFLVMAMMGASRGDAQTILKLTLSEARELAIRRHPQIKAATFTAKAADERPAQEQSAWYPNVDAAVTGADASKEAALAAGGLSNSSVLARLASGFTLNQLLFDAGRTSNLAESARLRARAAHQNANATRAEVILEVDRAYFNILRAQAIVTVAEQTVAARRLVVEQAETMQKNGLRSGLDASIARYDVAEAEMLLVQAQNDLQAAQAVLAAAIGSGDEYVFELADEPLPALPLPDAIRSVDAGLRDRPEIKALQFERAAAIEFLDAEKLLNSPSVTAMWSAGWIPLRERPLPDGYNAAAINVSIPLFEGPLFKAREAEASFKVQAADEQLTDAMHRVARDVRVARLDAENAFRRIDLAAGLVARAREARDLAQERYRLGLGSMVELSQTQLKLTAAEVEHASARFDFMIRRSILDFQTGQLP